MIPSHLRAAGQFRAKSGHFADILWVMTISNETWPQILGKLIRKADLDRAEAAWAMSQIMGGVATESQLGAFLLALRSKGETVVEMSGLVDIMLENAIRPEADVNSVDIVGTGGDQAGTVNISTMAAIVIAACGIPVMKIAR